MNTKELILSHIKEIDKEINREYSKGYNCELYKSKSIALLALTQLEQNNK